MTLSLSAFAQRERAGLLYGLFSGLALACAAWGWDAFQLWQAQGLLPWARFALGLLASLTLCGLAGWLTMRLRKPALAVLFWLLAVLPLAWLTYALTFQLWPSLAVTFFPDLAGRLAFPQEEQGVFIGFLALVLALTAILVGLFEIPLLEQTFFSAAAGAIVGPVTLAMTLFLLSGLVADNTMNARLRGPVLNLNHTIEFVATHDLAQVDKTTRRNMHIGALNDFLPLVKAPRRLMVAFFNLPYDQVDILVNFDGVWAYCYTSAAQPTYCKPAP